MVRKQLVALEYSSTCNPSGHPLPQHLQDEANAKFCAELASVLVPTYGRCFLTIHVAMLNSFGYTHAGSVDIALLDAEQHTVGSYEKLVDTILLNEADVPKASFIRISNILFPNLTVRTLILPCRMKTTLDAPYSRITVWIDPDAEKVFVSTDKTYNPNWMHEVPVKLGTEGQEELNGNILIEIPEERVAE